MKTIVGFVTAGMLFAGSLASAGSNDTPGIDRRQDNQDRRIEKGIERGQLTEREANQLNTRVDRIDAMEDKAKADGKVTKKERKGLHKGLNKNSRAVGKQKHDRQGTRRR